jgi:hypothetical protein
MTLALVTEPGAADRPENEAFEALADCDACLVESAVVELIAQAEVAGATQGIVLERRCRACLRESRAGGIVHGGESFRGEPARARAALERWAREEGDEDAARFVDAHFEHPIDVIAEQLARGERVQTCFDAIAWLFPGVGAVGGGGGGGGGVSTPVAPIDGTTLETGPPAFDVARPEITWPDVRRHRASLAPMAIPVTHESIPKHLQPLRVSARALASVMLADGLADATDRAFVDRTLAGWGHPPIEPADLAVWRPHDLGWPHDPRRGGARDVSPRLRRWPARRDRVARRARVRAQLGRVARGGRGLRAAAREGEREGPGEGVVVVQGPLRPMRRG